MSDALQLFPDGSYLRAFCDEAMNRVFRFGGLPDSEWLLAPLCRLLAISSSYAAIRNDQTTLPIEVLGADGTTVHTTLNLSAGQSESVRTLWLQIHGLRYAKEASVQVNANDWIPLSNNAVTIAKPGKSFGGIGGGFSILVMTVPLAKGMLTDGENTVRFRFNQTDGVVSGYRVLVAVTKALQSTDPHLGPDNLRQGWRPDTNVDPRIMISPPWQSVFEPLPGEVRQALTISLLAAWMDKHLQYPIATYLPIGLRANAYAPPVSYGGISGGRVWEAARQFRDAGVPGELVQRLEQWGILFTDRAARIQY